MQTAIIKMVTVILLTCMLNIAYAQTIKVTGTVNDNISKQVLPNATVIVKSVTNNNFSASVITNNRGLFLITVPQAGLYKIETSYSGYQNNTRDAVLIDEQHTAINAFYLVLAGKELKTVTVSAAKKPFITMDANKITLNVEQSAIAAGGNAYEVLKKAPGIMEQNDQLSFRGKSINILINGRPSNLTGEELKNMLTNMQASGIEKIEILPNPSAKYDATGGSVVNIVLVKNKLFGTNYVFTAGIGTGKNARGNTGLDFNHRSKNINVFGGYNFNHNQQYYKTNSTRYLGAGTITSDEYEVRERNNNSYKLGVDYDINKRSSVGGLINGYINYRNRVVNNTSVLHYNSNVFDSASIVATGGKAIFKNPAVNLYYKTTLDTTGKELTINADYLNYNKTWYDHFTNRYYDNEGKEYITPDYLQDNSPANINVYSLTADYIMPAKKARWEVGLKTNYSITDNDIVWQNSKSTGWANDAGKTNHFIYKENVNAAYLNYIRAIKKWNIQAGLRIEQTNTTGNSLTANRKDKNSYVDFFPNISLDYTKNENNVFSMSYRKSITRFGFNIVNPFVVYQNRYAYSQGNPGIQPEINHSIELSYIYKQAYSLTVDYIHGAKTLGEVYLPAVNNVTVSSYANYNTSDALYFSFSANKKITKNWQVSFNPMYGYISMNNTVKNVSAGSAKKLWVGQVQWGNSFSFKKGWTAEISLLYISPFQYGSYTTKTMFNSDLGISKTIMQNKASLKLGASDIFNTLNYNKELNYAGIVTSLKYKPESRFINLTFKYKFGNKNVKGNNRKQSKINDLKTRVQ
jgi:Outer membrane protein beta-barrel family/Carboxypeptidase regulatory-like domain